MGNLFAVYVRAPRPVQRAVHRAHVRREARRFAHRARPRRAGETSKARPRRVREGFFDANCQGAGLDVGFGGDLVTESCRGWDVEHGDAELLGGVADGSFDFVYSSHTLEHVGSTERALGNWWRVLRPGGRLILYVPDRDLYEKRTRLPSRFNPDHKRFFLLERDDPPDTVGLLPLVRRVLPDADVVYAKVCDFGHSVRDPTRHSDGEYSIEVVLRKPLN